MTLVGVPRGSDLASGGERRTFICKRTMIAAFKRQNEETRSPSKEYGGFGGFDFPCIEISSSKAGNQTAFMCSPALSSLLSH